MRRRRFKDRLSAPIQDFINDNDALRLIFVEKDHVAAVKTRAAALMYTKRHNIRLATTVRENEIWVMKDKDDFLGGDVFADLRD